MSKNKIEFSDLFVNEEKNTSGDFKVLWWKPKSSYDDQYPGTKVNNDVSDDEIKDIFLKTFESEIFENLVLFNDDILSDEDFQPIPGLEINTREDVKNIDKDYIEVDKYDGRVKLYDVKKVMAGTEEVFGYDYVVIDVNND